MSKNKSKKKPTKKEKDPQTKPKPFSQETSWDRSGTVNIRPHLPTILVCLLLIVATSAVYWQVGSHEFILYDDPLYITDNYRVQAGLSREGVLWAFTNTDAGNWHPLTWLSHMLDCELYGLNPKGHLVTNVILHIANAVLLFLLWRRMTGALWQSGFVAALFALHPLHVESVAWVAERKDVLSTLFWILTMWMYVRYVELPGIKRYLLILLSFAAGLMAKPMLVTLPFVLLLLDYWPLCRFNLGRSGINLDASNQTSFNAGQQRPLILSLVWEKTPLFALTVASSVATFLAQKVGGSISTLEIVPLNIRISNGLISYLKYMWMTIWPADLAVFYPLMETNLPKWQAIGAGALLIGITALVIRAAPRRPYLAVGWLWYLGTLVPVIGLVQVGGQAIADRYTYVPLIGLFIMIAWGIPELLAGWRYRKIVLTVVAGTLLSALTICTWLQVRYWKNNIVLCEHALKVTSKNYVAHANLGISLLEQGRLEEAVFHLFEATRIRPDYAEAQNSLGVALKRQGRLEEAIFHYSKALRLNPDLAATHNNLGSVLWDKGRIDEAIFHFSQATKIEPDYAQAHTNLGISLIEQGRLEEASFHFSEVLRINPDQAEPHNNLGIVLERQGRLEEAIFHYSEALRINPDYADVHDNLGNIMKEQGRLEEAIFHYSEALRINPKLAETQYNLGLTLQAQGKIDEAISHYLEAIWIKPDLAEAHNNLGIALERQGRLTEAMAHYSKALEVNPDYAEAHNNLGVALGRQGRLNDAIEHFYAALRLKPDFAQAQDNLEYALRLTGRSR